jgi:nicotinamide mononucleotide transporter
MSSLFVWLDSPALLLWSTPMTVAEVLGLITGIVCVWLAARNHIWNFPIGIANSLLLFQLFCRTRLFADATLQVVFILLNLRGWWQWARHGAAPVLPITNANTKHLILAMVYSGLGIVTLTVLLTLARGSVPVFDASIAALSLVAQWLMNRRLLQSWWWWIIVDVISIPVYVYKGLYLIALLYAVFLALCVSGYRNWRALLSAPVTAAAVALDRA